MVITHERHLAALDPSTGESIALLDAAADPALDRQVKRAAASADGRWVAFELTFCDGEGQTGLWVTDGASEPRQLTAPCASVEPSDDFEVDGRWAWSPTGSRLAAVESDQLILIDPVTGDRTELGQLPGDVTALAWSPDGTQVAYATRGGSVYRVSVDGGEHAVIAESLGDVPGGEEGSGLQWSPDGTRIAVLADANLYVMGLDGSDRRQLAEGVLVEHILGSPNIVWSPDGTRIAYATESDARDHFQVWSAALDGSAPVLVFEETTPGTNNALHGGPVWSPDGTRIVFRYDPTDEEKGLLVANADGTGEAREMGELQYLSWRGGWFFCECFG